MPKKKKTKRDGAHRISEKDLGWLLYLQTKEEAAKKDVQLAQHAIREYMHEHSLKLQHLRSELSAKEVAAARAKEERENFMAQLAKKLGIENWADWAVGEDGTLHYMKENEDEAADKA